MTKKEKQLERHDYKIFSLINDGEKTKIAIGNQLITDKEFENDEEAKEFIDKPDWELLANMMVFVSHNVTNQIINNQKK